jgi:rifampicin phosphotransferase
MPRVLGSRPQLQTRFWALLQVAQRHAVLREHQARQLTAGWPLLRRCALRLGELLHADGVIDRAEDVFFLTRTDLDAHAPAGCGRPAPGCLERQPRLLAP